MTTTAEARTTLMSALETAWLANATSAPLELQFDDVKADPPIGVDSEGRPVAWSRITMRHIGGSQDSFGDVGNRRFLEAGIVTQQIFTAPGDGHLLGDVLVGIVKGGMRSIRNAGGLWLFDITPVEIGISGAWFQTNVIADFRYDEVA